jgi:hypothetical protein
MSLSRLGRNAEEALPALNALKDSSDLATRHASLGALSIIDPTQPMIFETIIAEICASHPENRQLLESLRSSVSRNAPWDARPFRPCSDDIEYMLRCAAETPNWYGPKEAYLEAVVILRSQLSK